MKLRLITVIALICLSLCLLAACGEETPAGTTTAPTGAAPETTVPTMSWEEKDALDKQNMATNNSGLDIALKHLGVSESEVMVHTISNEEGRVVEIFLQYGDTMYHYTVDVETEKVLSVEQD